MFTNPNCSPEAIGKRIAERRKQMNMTQEQIAKLSGMSHQFFACVERGTKNMRAESIIKIAAAMNLSTDYILLGKSNSTDRANIMRLIKRLNEIQLKCLEEIIKNYVIACRFSDSISPAALPKTIQKHSDLHLKNYNKNEEE